MLKQQVVCVYVCVVLGDNIRILWLDMLLFQFLLAIQEEVWPLSSGYRTGKVQFSFQSQRKPRPNNVQTTIWLCSFHKLVRLCSKSFKLGFSSIWTKNFQLYKWILKRPRNQRSNCQHLLVKELQKNNYFRVTD